MKTHFLSTVRMHFLSRHVRCKYGLLERGPKRDLTRRTHANCTDSADVAKRNTSIVSDMYQHRLMLQQGSEESCEAAKKLQTEPAMLL